MVTTSQPLFGPEEKVLIVDDEAGLRAVLRRLFVRAGLPTKNLREAASAEEALSLVQRETFDLVVSDFRMSGKNGVDLMAWLREHRPATGRIIMTGYHDTSIAVDGLNLGRIHGFVQKPWDNARVLDTVRKILAQRRQARNEASRDALELAHFLHQVARRRAAAEQPRLGANGAAHPTGRLEP